jgi:hypothetical protein
MSGRGIEFLEEWIQANVTQADRGGDSIRAMVLADKCRAAAAAQGLKRADMESEWGSVETSIYEAMTHREESGTPGN